MKISIIARDEETGQEIPFTDLEAAYLRVALSRYRYQAIDDFRAEKGPEAMSGSYNTNPLNFPFIYPVLNRLEQKITGVFHWRARMIRDMREHLSAEEFSEWRREGLVPRGMEPYLDTAPKLGVESDV